MVHTGKELLPILFPNNISPRQMWALDNLLYDQVVLFYPVIAGQAIVFAEVIRTCPAEFGMFHRMWKRKKPNMAEILFILIKYIVFIATILQYIYLFTPIPGTSQRCRSFAWTSDTLFAICSTLVVSALAWRTQIVFRNSTKVRFLLLFGLIVQLGLSLMGILTQPKHEIADPYGFCQYNHSLHQHHHWYQSYYGWFLALSTIFDLILLISCSIRLFKTSRGPSGLTRIAKVLFTNNLHYLFAVESCNFAATICAMFFSGSTGNLVYLFIVIQVCFGLQLLISEQIAVYSNSSHSTNLATTNPSSSYTASQTSAKLIPFSSSFSSGSTSFGGPTNWKNRNDPPPPPFSKSNPWKQEHQDDGFVTIPFTEEKIKLPSFSDHHSPTQQQQQQHPVTIASIRASIHQRSLSQFD